MKKIFTRLMLISFISALTGCGNSKDPASWSDRKTDEWFNSCEWVNGWTVKPDNSIDKKTLAVNYFKNKERWDKAFAFLKDNDLSSIATGRHDIDGDNLFVSVSDYLTKDENQARFEAHRKYADIQYVVKGKEIMQIAPVAMQDTVYQEYDPNRDIEFFTVKEHKSLPASPEHFFIFFPTDAHKPGLKNETADSVRKVVIKLRID